MNQDENKKYLGMSMNAPGKYIDGQNGQESVA